MAGRELYGKRDPVKDQPRGKGLGVSEEPCECAGCMSECVWCVWVCSCLHSFGIRVTHCMVFFDIRIMGGRINLGRL